MVKIWRPATMHPAIQPVTGRASSRVRGIGNVVEGSTIAGARRVPSLAPSHASGGGIASVVLAGLVLLLPSIGLAGSAPLEVRVTVIDSCAIDSVSTLQFPSYTANSAQAVVGKADMLVHCAAGTPVEISLDAGENASGGLRRMRNGDSLIQYNLYTDSGYGTVWGNASFGEGPLAATILFNSSIFTIRGRIPAAQAVPAGNYSDTVTITMVVQ
jgi:spore coat protein U-like protein